MPHSVSPGTAQHDDDMPDAPPAESTENNVKLEEMFDDDDDEEFPASGDVKMESPAAKEEE